ncbi:MAG: hypothetical protein WEB53_11115 [Akkermansiaceae bacterium]
MTKPPRLLLHIGMHKTGSTSLQRFFVRNRAVLGCLGIDYPKAFDANGQLLPKHNDLFHAISHEKDFGKPHPALGPSAARVEKLACQIETKRITVVSAEGLSGENPAFAKAFAPLRGRIDVRVICFLRRQDEWAKSFYKQMVQSREVREGRNFEEFIAAHSTREHLNYFQLLDWWADALGDESIRVEIYKPDTRVLPAFLKAADLSKSLALLPFGNGVQNRSPVSGFVERLRAANVAGQERPVPNDTDEDKPYFTAEACAKFMNAFEAGNESIRARFRPDLVRLFD